MTSDLVAFLRARIDEDEQIARDAMAEPTGSGWWNNEGTVRSTGPDVVDWVYLPVADHIVWWHPGRVLAECEAKRRIIEAHSPPVPYTTPSGFEFEPEPEQSNQCRSCGYAELWEIEQYGPTYPCPTLLALAAVYSDHPDFDPGWMA
jgi:hypothetical protein